MKKLEFTLYLITMAILVLVIVIKSLAWPWIGPFLIVSYSILSLIFTMFSWIIYSTSYEKHKRQYFIYGTVPLGIAVDSLLIMIVAKLQHWPWYENACNITLVSFSIVAVVFAIAFLITNDVMKKGTIKQLLIKSLIFLTISIAMIFVNFDKIISALSGN